MKFYKLNCATLPDKLFNKGTDVKEWINLTTSIEGTFPPGSLNQVTPLARDVEIERIVGITLYLLGNVLPFALPILLVSAWFSEIGMLALKSFLLYFTILFTLSKYYFFPYFIAKYDRPKELSNDIRCNQYLHTERNNQKYTSLQFVWPETIHRPKLDGTPVIFCAIPHGAAPLGM